MHDAPGPLLTIARLQRVTTALGPGRRAVVWFQGCALACPRCIAAEMNAAAPVATMSARELAAWCMGIAGIDGVTLSGGDPLDQPLAALAELLEALRGAGLHVMLYTGRTLAQLRPDALLARVLAAVDLLVDGPYIEALNDGSGWRGSRNQIIHRLSARAEREAVAEPDRRRLEVTLEDGQIFMTGLPAAERAVDFSRRLLDAARTGDP